MPAPSPRRRFGRLPIARMLSGSVAGQGTILLVSPLLTRIYSASDFGTFALVTSISAVLGSVATLSWDRAIVIPRSPRQAEILLLLALGSTVGISLLFAAATFATRDAIADTFQSDAMREYWWLIPMTVLMIGIYNAMSSWLVRRREYGSIALRNALVGVSQAASSVFLGLAGVGTVGLASSLAVGRLFGAIATARSIDVGRLFRVRSSLVSLVARRFRRFPFILTWSRLVNSLGLQLPIILLIAIYGSVEVGLFALMVRVLASPVGVISDAVSQHFEGEISSRLREGLGGARRLITTTLVRLLAVGLLPSIAIALLGPALFSFVFGDVWTGAGELAQVAVWGYLAQFVVAPISRTLTIMEKQSMQLAWDLGRAFLVTAAIVASFVAGAALIDAVLAMTAAGVIAYVVLLVLSVRAARG